MVSIQLGLKMILASSALVAKLLSTSVKGDMGNPILTCAFNMSFSLPLDTDSATALHKACIEYSSFDCSKAGISTSIFQQSHGEFCGKVNSRTESSEQEFVLSLASFWRHLNDKNELFKT